MASFSLGPLVRRVAKKIPGARWTYVKVRGVLAKPDRNAEYDRQTLDVFRRVLKTDSVCVDVGAHVGDILREIIAVAPDARHHAIEALPHLASRLKRDFPSAEIHSCAVSDKTGEATFNYVENDPAFSGLQARTYTRDPVIQKIQVSVGRIDDLIPEQAQVRLIKVDVEGGEFHALRGAKKTLLRCRPIVVFEHGIGGPEAYGVTPEMMYAFFDSDLKFGVSTMARWLAGKSPYDLRTFVKSFRTGKDYYYIAFPR